MGGGQLSGPISEEFFIIISVDLVEVVSKGIPGTTIKDPERVLKDLMFEEGLGVGDHLFS